MSLTRPETAIIATVIISMLAFRIAPGEESVEAAGENIIKVLPGLKFKAKGATATFIILIALSSLIILNQADNVITPLENERELDKLRDFLINHELLDTSAQESTRFNIDAAINSIDLYLQTVEQGLNKWTLNTKLGMYNPKSQGSDLMSDTEVRQIMNEDTLKVRVESVPKIEPPYGTNVTIEKLLYFPIGVKNIDDVRRAIEDSNDGINLEFEVQKLALIIVSATQTKQAWFQGIRSPCGTRLSSSIVRVNHQ